MIIMNTINNHGLLYKDKQNWECFLYDIRYHKSHDVGNLVYHMIPIFTLNLKLNEMGGSVISTFFSIYLLITCDLGLVFKLWEWQYHFHIFTIIFFLKSDLFRNQLESLNVSHQNLINSKIS